MVVQPGLLQRLGILKHSFCSLRLSLSYTHPFFTPHLYHKFPKGFVCLPVREREGGGQKQGGETQCLFHSAKDCDSLGCTVSGSAEFHDLRLRTVCVQVICGCLRVAVHSLSGRVTGATSPHRHASICLLMVEDSLSSSVCLCTRCCREGYLPSPSLLTYKQGLSEEMTQFLYLAVSVQDAFVSRCECSHPLSLVRLVNDNASILHGVFFFLSQSAQCAEQLHHHSHRWW